MKRDDVKRSMPHLCDQWIKASNKESTPLNQLGFYDFYQWLQENHREYIEFRSEAGPMYDLELWFDQNFKQAWSR